MELAPDTQLINIKQITKTPNEGQFILEPLLPGYGITIGNTLRRVLLSSMPGAAITTIQIEGANHEFTTINGVKEDLVDLILNLKGVRFRLMQNEPINLTLEVTGPKEIIAGDFAKAANIEIANPEHYIATIEKKKKLSLQAMVEKGFGYLPTEKRKDLKLPIGMIAIDSFYSPVTKVNITTENTRVGQMTNYDKLIIDITTDGTIEPITALQSATQILIEQLSKISALIPEAPESTRKVRKRASKQI